MADLTGRFDIDAAALDLAKLMHEAFNDELRKAQAEGLESDRRAPRPWEHLSRLTKRYHLAVARRIIERSSR
jgi:hypothetical protein